MGFLIVCQLAQTNIVFIVGFTEQLLITDISIESLMIGFLFINVINYGIKQCAAYN